MEGRDGRSKYRVDRRCKNKGHRTKGLTCGSAATNKFFRLKGIVNVLFHDPQIKPHKNAYYCNSHALKYKEVHSRNENFISRIRYTAVATDTSDFC